jgi:radical SAM protein with 4Fe4S-binding SPASM domain
VTVPDVRFRKEPFGYVLAFATGDVGYYSEAVGPLLLQEPTHAELEAHRLARLPVGENFHLSAPLIVWLEITRRCNLPCKHCYVAAGRRRANELTTEEIFSTLDQLKAMGVFALVIVGGEPTLHPDFLRVTSHAHELGFVLSVVTNGTHITQDIIDKLPREECIVSVSLDGIESHQDMRINTTYEQVLESLLLLRKNGYPTAVVSTLTNFNVGELDRLFDFSYENGFYFSSGPFLPIGRGRHFPQYIPGLEIIEQAAQLYIRESHYEKDMFEKNGLCVAKFLEQCYVLSHATKREFCGIALAYVLSDGSVYPCSTCASTGKYLAGNLRDARFADIWAQSFQDIRQVTFADFAGCADCELSKEPYFCTSHCPVMSEILTGDPFLCGATPFVKGSLKRRTELVLNQAPVPDGQTDT